MSEEEDKFIDVLPQHRETLSRVIAMAEKDGSPKALEAAASCRRVQARTIRYERRQKKDEK